MDECIFCKIVKGEVPASVVYEDDLTLAFPLWISGTSTPATRSLP
jgi:hypothetical protein